MLVAASLAERCAALRRGATRLAERSLAKVGSISTQTQLRRMLLAYMSVPVLASLSVVVLAVLRFYLLFPSRSTLPVVSIIAHSKQASKLESDANNKHTSKLGLGLSRNVTAGDPSSAKMDLVSPFYLSPPSPSPSASQRAAGAETSHDRSLSACGKLRKASVHTSVLDPLEADRHSGNFLQSKQHALLAETIRLNH